jgi:DNA-binding transcriptional ArsR family regulator
MKFPLVVGDFLDRAEHVYPDRVAVVDEPDQSTPSLGSLTYREVARNARAQAAKLDALGVPVGGRVAFVSQNSTRLYTSFFGVSAFGRVLVPINFRLSRAEIAYIVEHSGSDITVRSRRLADAGLQGLFADLHRRATWRDDELHLSGFRRGTVDLRGRGLVLVPTAFGWPNLGIGPTDDTSAVPPVLVYPMLGTARLWEPATQPVAIARLLGAGRACVLAETLVPSTTTSLARRVGLASATVSQHLGVLRDAGLVTAERRGREVFYRQTVLASALLRPDQC